MFGPNMKWKIILQEEYKKWEMLSEKLSTEALPRCVIEDNSASLQHQ